MSYYRIFFFFFSSRRRHTRLQGDWSSDVCSSDLPDPHTLVVVNCAGRTRSIAGAQTLIDAGIPNQVVSLRNGTMDWLLTGRRLAHGRRTPLPEPGAVALATARERAASVAQRAGVQSIDAAELARFESEATERTLYRFDVRTREEYQAGHLPGWRWRSEERRGGKE